MISQCKEKCNKNSSKKNEKCGNNCAKEKPKVDKANEACETCKIKAEMDFVHCKKHLKTEYVLKFEEVRKARVNSSCMLLK